MHDHSSLSPFCRNSPSKANVLIQTQSPKENFHGVPLGGHLLLASGTYSQKSLYDFSSFKNKYISLSNWDCSIASKGCSYICRNEMPFRSSAIQTRRVGNSGFPMHAVRSGSTTATSSSSSFDDDWCVVVIVVFGPTNRTDLNSPAPESKNGNTTKSPSNIPSHNSSSSSLDFSDDAFCCGGLLTFRCQRTWNRS